MALALLVNTALAGIGDVNQYYNLMTGAMNDQPVTLNYRPGSGTTPTLTLKTDGRPLIKGFKSDNTTQAFQVDQNGNLTIAGALTIVGAISGATTAAFSGQVQAASYAGAAGAAAQIAVYDNGLGTVRLIKLYEGATDPSTYDTVPEGSWWIKG